MFVVQHKLPLDICFYQIEQSVKDGYCYYLASQETPSELFSRLKEVLQKIQKKLAITSQIEAIDVKAKYYRQSYFKGSELQAGLFVASTKQQLPQGWDSHFYDHRAGDMQKRGSIAANVVNLQDEKIFCQCLKVPVSKIKAAIADKAVNVDQVRKCTGAGNSCGSCIGDISLMLGHYLKQVS